MSDQGPVDFMREAIRLAVENVRAGTGGPFGAVVVKDGRIIARGSNRVTASNDPTAHAEVMAIREACRELGDFQLTGCEIYCSSEPCPMCMGAIYWTRADRIYYAATRSDAQSIGFDDQFIYDELERPIEAREIPARRLLAQEALEAFELWARQEDRVDF